MTHYLIGARGRLGQAIAQEYAGSAITALGRQVYEAWSRPGAAGKVSRYFEKHASQGACVFVASGLLDPRLPQDDLLGVNYHLPKNLVDGAATLGLRVITFGTVMEGLLQSKNPYVLSKTRLSDYVRTLALAASPVLHLQMHTLYGLGQPSPFMFLGQMLAALRQNAAFGMTSGRQLREYHHLADEAKAIRQLATLGCSGVMHVSHGKPLSLRVLAEAVFQAFNQSGLLQLGRLPEPCEENYQQAFEPATELQSLQFRDALPAVVQYLQECHA